MVISAGPYAPPTEWQETRGWGTPASAQPVPHAGEHLALLVLELLLAQHACLAKISQLAKLIGNVSGLRRLVRWRSAFCQQRLYLSERRLGLAIASDEHGVIRLLGLLPLMNVA